MRLHHLTLGQFKNLREFAVNFDFDAPTTVLVGRNGTGKSNLLEALTIIFRDLDLGKVPAFPFKLSYTCREHLVEIESNSSSSHKCSIRINGEAASLPTLADRSDGGFLPRYVFGYYSGPSDRMEEHYRLHQKRFYDELLRGVNRPLRPLLYARPVHSQFVLLSFFLENDEEALEFLSEYLGIMALESVLFVMREPPWNSNEGDPRFWNARGVVENLLSCLYDLSLAPLRLQQKVAVGLSKTRRREHLYLYLPDVESLFRLSREYPTQQELFKAFESTYISDLIAEVRIRVRARNVGGSLTFRELSEGEQQLLMVLGLLRFTREEESLFLLDEPDTHLNPAWSVQYLDFLRDIGGAHENTHTIMATHDPLVVASLEKEHVRLLQRDEESGLIAAYEPEEDPWKLGVAGLLTSEVYGLRSQLAPRVLDDLNRKRHLAAAAELSPTEGEELRRLNDELGGVDFTATTRDPLYPRFVEAMAQKQAALGLKKAVLTPKEQDKLRQIALDIVRKLDDLER